MWKGANALLKRLKGEFGRGLKSRNIDTEEDTKASVKEVF